MKRFSLSIFVFIAFYTLAFSQHLIPAPSSITLSKSAGFMVDGNTAIIGNTVANMENIKVFNALYTMRFKNSLNVLLNPPRRNNAVYVREIKNDTTSAYTLDVYKDSIVIVGSLKGCFYGLMTTLQLIEKQLSGAYLVKPVSIKDAPAFDWRGMHLDVSRHFFSVDDVKRYIDMMALYKMNVFHWHLTDDQGWRIEIKKYPKLTEIGAWRSATLKGHACEFPEHYDSTKHGGFYTQEQVKDVIAYAAQRHITIIPEIEMPGHAQAAIAAYPNVSCKGDPLKVAQKWGVFDDVFCAKDENFTFLEDVLTEVMALFPAPIIHIGGDECPKVRWKVCPKCQAVKTREGLKDEHELQSYFIKRIEKFVNSKGKTIIGWDEILDGGLAPNAMVMSWRGIEGGLAAVKQNHKVVMTPTEWCYLDHYQGNPQFEPLAIGWFTPLDNVYSFDPIPAELPDSLRSFILGSQGNIWTEYIPTMKHLEYMALPRMGAMAEVLWTYPKKRDYKEFYTRVNNHVKMLGQMGFNYSMSHTNTRMHIDSTKDYTGLNILLSHPDTACVIYYTVDGSEPTNTSTVYSKPITAVATTMIKAQAYKLNKPVGALLEYKLLINKATGKKVRFNTQPEAEFGEGGAFALVNGISAKGFSYDPCWIGFVNKDVEMVVDLGKPTEVNRVSLSTENADLGWITSPKGMKVFFSNDDKKYTIEASMDGGEIKALGRYLQVFTGGITARYVKIILENYNKIPPGFKGEGDDAWLFVDELTIE